MPTFTAGAVSDKISELRSKIAVFETFMNQIRSNWLSSEAGAAELRIVRLDGAAVTDDHFTAVLGDIEERIEVLREELEEWENLTFSAAEKVEKPQPKLIEVPKEKKKNVTATKRQHPNTATTK